MTIYVNNKGEKMEINLLPKSTNWEYGEGDVLKNKKYLADRNRLFREHGNGWWWEKPAKQLKKGD